MSSVVNFSQSFNVVRFPTGSLLHQQPGRSVHHNLHRLPSPEPTHDFRTSILLGGNHPQNQFRNFSSRQGTRALSQSSIGGASDQTGTYQPRGSTKPLATKANDEEWTGPEDLASYFKHPPPGVIPRGGAESHTALPSAGGGRVMTPVPTVRPPTVDPFPPAPSRGTADRLSGSAAGGAPRAQSSLGTRGGVGLNDSVRSLRPDQVSNAANSESRFAAKLHSSIGSRAGLRPDQKPTPGSRATTANSHASPVRSTSASPGATPASPSSPPAFRRKGRVGSGEEFGDFSLQINGDYDTPFKTQVLDLDNANWIQRELDRFEKRKDEPARLSTLPTVPFAPPRIIIMMFRFSNVRNLAATKALQKVGYPELHEQFSTTARGGTISKGQFGTVVSKYLNSIDRLESFKILDCFDRNALGDVDLNMLLIGLQILLECAAPGDAMRYCFTLMDTTNKIPRYITRYEVQTLVAYASAFEADADESMDAEYLMMARSIQELLKEASRYDYMGRMPLKEFLEALDDKVRTKTLAEQKGKRKMRHIAIPNHAHQQQQHGQGGHSGGGAAGHGSGAEGTPEKKANEFQFGKMWNTSNAAVTAVHRMSSKKMIVASTTLTPMPHGAGNPASPFR